MSQYFSQDRQLPFIVQSDLVDNDAKFLAHPCLNSTGLLFQWTPPNAHGKSQRPRHPKHRVFEEDSLILITASPCRAPAAFQLDHTQLLLALPVLVNIRQPVYPLPPQPASQRLSHDPIWTHCVHYGHKTDLLLQQLQVRALSVILRARHKPSTISQETSLGQAGK
uniref:Uncharacterized protein n=1 Tax=uncultured Acidobacteriales bacterium HF0200_23L05 TaxID=710732 RepID=E0XUJ0_9BACT|nr:hypothetical protein [uncultured Acidobacteriales bacterium HF0200_23L05]